MSDFITLLLLVIAQKKHGARGIRQMPFWFLLRLLYAAMIVTAASTVSFAQPGGFVGVYAWGGQLASHDDVRGFYDTVKLALSSGFDTVRLKIGPGQASDYQIHPDPCSASPNLGCYAKVMFNSPIWDDLRLKRIIITTNDFSCQTDGGNKGCLTAALLEKNGFKIQSEYLNLFGALYERFKGKNIQFIISNWEGDNRIYCGDSFHFGSDPAFASKCKDEIASDGQDAAERISAFLQWLRIKDVAVDEFTAKHQDFKLLHAPEFNNYRQFKNGCAGFCDVGLMNKDTLIGAMMQAGGRPYCSYSAYDSQGREGDGFANDVGQILHVCHNLMIGEAGYDIDHAGDARSKHLFEKLDKIRQIPGVIGIVIWNAVNPENHSQKFGLWTRSGSEQQFSNLGPLRPKANNLGP